MFTWGDYTNKLIPYIKEAYQKTENDFWYLSSTEYFVSKALG